MPDTSDYAQNKQVRHDKNWWWKIGVDGVYLLIMSSEVRRIAHLFLSGVDSSSEGLRVQALMVGHLGDAGGAVRRVSQYWARQLGKVGLLECGGGGARLRVLSTSEWSGQEQSKGGSAIKEAEGLSGALAEVGGQSSLLLVVADEENSVLAECEQISVVSLPEPESLVATYGQIKKLRPRRGGELGLTLVDCSSVAEGERLAERMRQTTQEFLDSPLRVDAIVVKNSRLRERKLAQIRTVDERTLCKGISLLGRGER